MKWLIQLTMGGALALAGSALGEPILSSWYTVHSGDPARIYRTEADREAGRSVTTWSNGRQTQAVPADTGVQAVAASANWVYVRSTGLGSQIMGPWYMDAQHYRTFPNLPTDQRILFAFPRHPVVMNHYSRQGLGDIGLTVDGVPIFDANDAFSYAHEYGRDADPRAGIGQGDHIWERDAYVNEGMTFDAGLGHQQNWGRYHYHADAIALRYELGDHVDFDPGTKMYHESTGPVTRHSPILGWMKDGYPLYGPYGYANPTNAASGVRRMVSGFELRDGSAGADDLRVTGRNTLPAWDARERGRSAELAESETGPAVGGRYPLGHFLQDYAFKGDLGKKQGQDYDLDELNGRWCVTPEFPQGTYAYFTTITATGQSAFPYTMGRSYHGMPWGRQIREIRETVQVVFTSPGVTDAATGTRRGPASATMVWTPNEGGQYQTR